MTNELASAPSMRQKIADRLQDHGFVEISIEQFSSPDEFRELIAALRSETRESIIDILRRAVAWHTPGSIPSQTLSEYWLDDAIRALKNAAPQDITQMIHDAGDEREKP